MSKIIFNYKRTETSISCKKQEKIKDICKRYLSENNLDENKIFFLYNGNIVNEELTFQQLINSSDNDLNSIKLIVLDKDTKDYIKLNVNKNNVKYKRNPNLKYVLDITNTNEKYGMNDIFEVFISQKDNQEYIVSPNINYNLDIFLLMKNKKILSLERHKNRISTIRYFINDKDNNEYLISADKNKIVIIWEINNDYKIKYEIETSYDKYIYSCLMIFPHDNDEDYFITSTDSTNDNRNESSSKLYSLNNGTFIRYINNSYKNKIWYLLSWKDKINNKYYIIQLSFKKVIINNLFDDDDFTELVNVPEHNHYSGLIFNKDNKDYLCCSSQNGFIKIWDLNNKKILKIINCYKSQLLHIIEWNNKYLIVADSMARSFKIIDLDIGKVISNFETKHQTNIICVKKINQFIYGDLLLTAGYDKTIKLWSM